MDEGRNPAQAHIPNFWGSMCLSTVEVTQVVKWGGISYPAAGGLLRHSVGFAPGICPVCRGCHRTLALIWSVQAGSGEHV